MYLIIFFFGYSKIVYFQRTFPEAFFKALESAGAPAAAQAAWHQSAPLAEVVESLRKPTPTRHHAMIAALRRGAKIEDVREAAFGVDGHWSVD